MRVELEMNHADGRLPHHAFIRSTLYK